MSITSASRAVLYVMLHVARPPLPRQFPRGFLGHPPSLIAFSVIDFHYRPSYHRISIRMSAGRHGGVAKT